MLNHYLKNNLFLFFLFLGFSYAFGVLSVGHYSMIAPSYYNGLWVSALVGVAIFFGLRVAPIKRVGFSTITWLGLALVISIQPFINHVNYPDVLIFPVGFLLLASILSILVVNLPSTKRTMMVHGIAWCLLIVGVFSAITQYIQLFYPNQFDFISKVALPISRSEGNVAQPNQASFIAVLGISSILYLANQLYLTIKNQDAKNHKNKKMALMVLFFGFSLFFLTSAIAITLSRTGIILFAIALLGMVFYTWVSHKWRFIFFGLTGIISVLGYYFGSKLGSALLSIQDTTGIDRLMATGSELRAILWERAWWAFSSNPIAGIGYNNYLWYGWENMEKLTWFENADHAHNVVLQIGAELGLLGLMTLIGVIFVLLTQLVRFFQRKLNAQDLFLCTMIAIFVAYSFSEFPLWSPFFAFVFVILVGLLDKGFSLVFDIRKPLVAMTVILSALATFYAGFYHYYLTHYEIVTVAKVDNQQKINAYHQFPTIPGFVIIKEHMLHIVVDHEKTDNINRFIEMGYRLIKANPDIDLMEIQALLLMRYDRQEEADSLNRKMCIWERQEQIKGKYTDTNCTVVFKNISKIDPTDKMGYAKRLKEWYSKKYDNHNKQGS